MKLENQHGMRVPGTLGAVPWYAAEAMDYKFSWFLHIRLSVIQHQALYDTQLTGKSTNE